MRPVPVLAVCLLVASVASVSAAAFVNFETGQVRPLSMSPDGGRLFAVNTPDNRLEIFAIDAAGLTHTASVPVGLEPIAVAARTDAEVWVVNHLSDSISIVDVAATPPRVTGTLYTCDEPRDLVFAGPAGRAFVTAARRGQNCSVAAELTTPGLGRAVVQVFDPTALGLDASVGGTSVADVVLFGDTPRALARSADGGTVWAAVFHSGNETTALNEGVVCDGGAGASPCGAFLQFPGGLPAPNANVENVLGPEVGLVVKRNPATGRWEDGLARDWSAAVRFDLPDLDVFAIDAAAATPIETASFAHVGTVLFDMVANPVSGRLYVSNTEARNEVRFEGPGLAFASTTVQGHLHEARVTVIDGASVLPRHLNKHIDYAVRPAPPGVKERSLATPLGMAVTADGATLYVAAFGSAKIGVFDTTELETDAFTPSPTSHIPVTGGGPTGLVLDEARDRLYVFTRFDNAISTVRLSTRAEVAHQPVFSPEPAAIVHGRPLLYDAVATSSNGEASCASCHVFGDFDSLAWDLGNPDDVVLNDPIPRRIPPILDTFPDFHPLKGPMTTQSLRGMAGHGSMHWRGDRTGGNDPGGSPFDEEAAFKKFNVAFPGLIGRESEIGDEAMQAFTDFVLTVAYPPNPIRRLNGTFTTRQQEGHDLFFGRVTDTVFNCDGCHRLDASQGFFGSDGFSTFEGETQMFKIPHLRNAYQKVGMFGRPQDSVFQGPQVRGFGFLHDGSVDTIFHFLGAGVFTLTGPEQRSLEQFVLAFDTNLAPVVGQQVTRSAAVTTGGGRLDLLITRATQFGECDIVVKGTIAGEERGGWLTPAGFQLDRAAETPIADADLRLVAEAPGNVSTYTCVPPGSGVRMGVDRDEDGVFDRDELDVSSDPADPRRTPPTPVRATELTLRDDDRPPLDAGRRRLSFRSSRYKGVSGGVGVPPAGGDGDPTPSGAAGGGAILTVHNAGGGSGSVVLALPAARWTRRGTATNPRYTYRDPKGDDGPIGSITLRDGTLRVRGRGAGLYPLAGAPQGALAVRLELGARFGFCATAPAKLPDASNDTPAKFVGERHTVPPPRCPPVT